MLVNKCFSKSHIFVNFFIEISVEIPYQYTVWIRDKYLDAHHRNPATTESVM